MSTSHPPREMLRLRVQAELDNAAERGTTPYGRFVFWLVAKPGVKLLQRFFPKSRDAETDGMELSLWRLTNGSTIVMQRLSSGGVEVYNASKWMGLADVGVETLGYGQIPLDELPPE